MPDRIVRAGILTSDSVNSLSWAAECFYRRLMSVADDYGRYDGRPSILRASLYPLKLDRVSERDIETWLRQCEAAGLVTVYTVDSRQYLEILKFDQRLRALTSKWPPPPTSADIRPRMTTDAAESESDTETENTLSGGTPDRVNGKGGITGQALEVLQFLNDTTGRKFRGLDANHKPSANLELIIARLKTGVSVQDCKNVIARKHKEWAGKDDMQQYLRPETLFNKRKFEQYLGQCDTEVKKPKAEHIKCVECGEPYRFRIEGRPYCFEHYDKRMAVRQ